MVGVPMLKPAPGRYAFTGGISLTHDLSVAIGCTPIVDACDLGIRPDERRPDGQCAGAAAHVQKLSLSVKIQIGKDGVVDALHHSSTAERVLPPDPAAPAEQQQQ